MPITSYLEKNAREHGDEVALIELNPEQKETRRVSWKEYSLIEQTDAQPYRREITWSVFDEKANRVANMLLSRGVGRGDKVAINSIIDIILTYGDEYKEKQIARDMDKNDIRNYRAMMSAA